MADRTSAEVFSIIFEELAAHADDERIRDIAKRIFKATSHYDFSTYQMGCDEALEALEIDIDEDE